MKNVNVMTLAMLAAAIGHAAPPPKYKVTDLGTLGGTFSQAYVINNAGVIGGLASAKDGTQHAVLWRDGNIKDISTPGLGNLNSSVFGLNEKGQVSIQGETAAKDPNNENVCVYGTGQVCAPFVGRDGVNAALPLLGGSNGSVGQINSRGEIAGFAETGRRPGMLA